LRLLVQGSRSFAAVTRGPYQAARGVLS
jgi:hypothetical protein